MPINVNGFSCTLADGVRETTQTTGTGTYSLDGPATVDGVTYRTFVAALGNGTRTVYSARLGSNFENGIGTITAGAPDTLSRDTILASSNSGNAVSWPGDPVDIMCAPVVAMLHSLQDQIDAVGATFTTTATVDLVGLASAGIPTPFSETPIEMTVQMNGLGFAGNNSALVQLGTSSGYVTTGYVSNSFRHDVPGTVFQATEGFAVRMGSAGAAVHGLMYLMRAGSGRWIATHIARYDSGLAVVSGAGTISLASVDRLRIISNAGATFSTGNFTVNARF